MSKTKSFSNSWVIILISLLFIIVICCGCKKATSYFMRPRSYRGRTDYDRYISCISEGGYWLNGMCSTVSLPGSQSIQPAPPFYSHTQAPPFLYGYYDNYPYYYFPSYKQRHPYWERRKYQKHYI